MLLHESYIISSVNIFLARVVPSKSFRVCYQALCIGANVMQDPARERSGNNINRIGDNLHESSEPVSGDGNLALAGDAVKKKPTSFQITSVTVQGSRLSTDGGEDSCDDLDVSHTEDLSSEIQDVSRTTDFDNDPLSEETSTSASYGNPEKTLLTARPHQQTSVVPKCDSEIPSPVTSSAPTNSEKPSLDVTAKPPTLPDQWQHRFKVVKIVSSRPFKKGRWVCMDFNDPPSVASSEAKPETPESAVVPTLPNMVSGGVDSMTQGQPISNVAHVYEITPNATYPGSISVTVSPQPVQQPFYGIFLPLNNPQYPDMATVPPPFAQDALNFDPKSQFIHQAVPFVQQPLQQQQTQLLHQQTYISNKPFEDQQAYATSQQQQQQQPSANVVAPAMQQLPATSCISMPVQQPTVVEAVIVPQQQQQPTPATTVIPQMQQLATQVVHSSVLQPVVMPQISQVSPATVQHQLPSGTQSPIPVVQNHPTGTTQPQIQNPGVIGGAEGTVSEAGSSHPSHVPHNHVDSAVDSIPQANPEVSSDPNSTSANKEVASSDGDSTSGTGGSTVAIDNKIEQAMDLVKSHLMFAVREEVDVLKEKITELMERISLLEYENGFLRANASHETLSQLNQSQQLQQQQQQQQQTQNTALPSATMLPSAVQQNVTTQQPSL